MKEKKMDFDIDSIKKIIVHQLRRLKGSNEFEVKHSKHLIDKVNLREIESRVTFKINDLLPKGMAMDICPDGKIFNIAKKIPKMKDEDFIESSHIAADKLALSQTPSAKDGVLIVIHAKIKKKNIVVFVKSEFEEGFEAKLEENKDNVTMKLLENIILTHTDYYKIGAFLCDEDDQWVSVLYDNLTKKGPKAKPAKYFYESFLELSLSKTDKNLVLNFYDITKEFINDKYSGRELSDKMTRLSDYLKSPDNLHVNITQFSQGYSEEDRRDYSIFMHEKKFPKRNISKNPEMIEKHFKYRTLRFQDGININIPSDKFKSNFILIDPKDIEAESLDKEGWTFIAVKGTVISEK